MPNSKHLGGGTCVADIVSVNEFIRSQVSLGLDPVKLIAAQHETVLNKLAKLGPLPPKVATLISDKMCEGPWSDRPGQQ